MLFTIINENIPHRNVATNGLSTVHLTSATMEPVIDTVRRAGEGGKGRNSCLGVVARLLAIKGSG